MWPHCSISRICTRWRNRLQYLGAAIESADECILILNLENTVIYVNPAYEKQHGVRLADIAGQQPEACTTRRNRTAMNSRHDSGHRARRVVAWER
jgi:PAS domain S-box-containing protein